MINLHEANLKEFEKLGNGRFGTVYKVNDEYAIKVFHDGLEGPSGLISNPEKAYHPLKLYQLRQKAKDLKYTDLVEDTVYIDGKFAGFKIKYYPGETLTHFMRKPFVIKRTIAEEIVRDNKELSDHHIYQLDYRLDNIMYDSSVHLVDLDGSYTKVLPFGLRTYARRAELGACETINALFNCYYYNDCSKRNLDTIREIEEVTTYPEVEELIADKSRPHNFIFVDQDSDISLARSLSGDNSYYVYTVESLWSSKDKLKDVISRYQDAGIPLYDIATYYNREFYQYDFNIESSQEVTKNKVLVKIDNRH